jgi:hypothetical protein
MFGYESVVTFFKCANMSVVFGLGIYVYKKYGLPYILFLMEQEKEEYEGYKNQQVDLDSEHALLAQSIQEDALLCETLKKRIDEWKKASDELEIREAKTRQAYADSLLKKREQKEQLRAQGRIKEEVAFAVAHTLRNSLMSYFEDDAHAQRYVHDIVISIERNV